ESGGEPLRSASSLTDRNAEERNRHQRKRQLVDEPAEKGEKRKRAKRSQSGRTTQGRDIRTFKLAEREQGACEDSEQGSGEATGSGCRPERNRSRHEESRGGGGP